MSLGTCANSLHLVDWLDQSLGGHLLVCDGGKIQYHFRPQNVLNP